MIRLPDQLATTGQLKKKQTIITVQFLSSDLPVVMMSSEVTDAILSITHDWLEDGNVRKREKWYQCVCLVKTDQMICKLLGEDHFPEKGPF